MAEIGTALASKVIERVVDSIVVHARYLFRFNKFVIDFRKSKRELEKTLKHMKERAREVTTNAEKIEQPVEEWFNEVEKVLEDALKLEERVEESQSCLNVRLQYSLAKEVMNMTQQMNMLNNNNNNKFEPFSRPIELSSMNYFFPKDFEVLDSRKPVYEKLLKAIQDDSSNVIGLVGMGGSGKSTLARVVGKQLEESKIFDKVVMTVVSQDVKVRDIQGQIADHLTFSLMEETELGRALRLSHRLKTEKILIIVDGVLEKLDLEAIGIPLNNNHNRCCILLTTRNQEVCTSMNCQSIIQLSVLTQDEGWTLFKQRAQIDDDSPDDLREVAKKVFDKCQGLLVAILTVANMLKGKCCIGWELALSRLETCQSNDVQEGLTSTHECNGLEEIICLDSKEDGQLRYLYAPSLPVFPKLRKILIKGCYKLRKIFFPSIVSSLPELKELCVHDCNELVEIISLYSLEQAGQFSNLSFPSQQVSFPKLGVIEIKRCNKLKTIFFAINVSSLPELKELSIHECNNLEDIISPDSKEAQQQRNVTSPFQQFFPKLWRINIENCNKLKTLFYLPMVTSLPELQQLVVKDCNNWEEIIVSDSEQARQFRNLSPLHQQVCLPKLQSIHIERCNKLKTIFSITTVACLPELIELIVKDCNQWIETISLNLEQPRLVGNLSVHSKQVYFPKLQRIEIESCKMLKTIFSAAIVTSLPELEQLVIKDCSEWEEIISTNSEEAGQPIFDSSKQICFPKLQRIEIESCKMLKSIFSAAIVTSLPQLEQLVLKDCNEWEEIISTNSKEAGQPRLLFDSSKQDCFPRLRMIEIEKCNKLKTIFSTTIVTMLPKLEELVVKDCNEWEEIISFDSEEDGVLKNLLVPSTQICFPKLRDIRIERCCKFRRMFPASIVKILPELTQLVVKDCSEWVEIISLDLEDVGQHRNLPAPSQQICFRRLRKIEIERCNKLKAIFSSTIVTRLPRLEILTVRDCNEMEEVISLDSDEVGKLRNLPALSQQVCFPVLFMIRIERCNRLKTIFPATIVTSLPELFQLVVKDCNEWEEIISSDIEELGQQRSLTAPSQQICFPKLQTISIEKCNKLKTIFYSTMVTSLTELHHIDVKDCNELEEIVALPSVEAGQSRNLHTPFQQVCFPKLGILWILGCNKMKTIFFATFFSTLPSLTSLFISDCDNMEAIVSSYSMESERFRYLSALHHQVCFPKLDSIVIANCEKLKNFFFTTTVSSLPELKRLYVLNCNKLEDMISPDSREVDPLRNLSTPSKQVYFPKLEMIDIQKCNKLKNVFSLTIVGILPELRSLHVNDCNELEEILSIDSEEVAQVENFSALSQQVCFPKLSSIWVEICNNIKFVFSYSIACHCPSLHALGIESCSKLEQIVKFEHKATSEEAGGAVVVDDDHGKYLLFPNLHWLQLKKLPTLTGIFPWFEYQYGPFFQHGILTIENCPKYLLPSISP